MKGFDFALGGALASADDRTGVTHAASGRRGGSGDEAGDGLFAIFSDPLGSFFFSRSADFTDHDEGFGVRVVVEHFHDIEVRGAIDGVAADANAGGLAMAAAGELPHGFVGEGAGARDDADLAGVVDVTGHDADFAGAGGDDAGAVRANEAGGAFLKRGFDPHHVDDGDAFGDADDEFDPGINGFEDRVGGAGGRDEDHGGVATGLGAGLHDGVENGDLAFEGLAAAAGSDSGDDIGSVIHAGFGVEATGFSCDALHEQAGVFVNEDGHGVKRFGLGGSGDDFLGGVSDIGGGGEFEAGLGEEFAAGFDIGSLEADDERDGEVDGFRGVDDALGDDVALHDAAENIDEDRFHIFVGDEDFEGLGDLLLVGSAADIKEVRWFAAAVFDDIHRGHGEAGAVDEAGDVSVEADVVEVRLRGFDFAGILLGGVAVGEDVGVAEEGVVVEVELRIERADVAGFGDDKRVDLHHRAIAGDEEAVEVFKERAGGLEECGGNAEELRKFARLVGLEAEERVDRDVVDFFGGLFGDGFDVHATFGAGNYDRCGSRAVDEHRDVEFLFDLDGLGDEDLANEASIRTGLVGNEGLAEHFRGEIAGFGRGFAKMDTALEAVFKRTLAAAAGVDLGFDDEIFACERGGDFFGFLGSGGDAAGAVGDAVFIEEFFGLVFVDVHQVVKRAVL